MFNSNGEKERKQDYVAVDNFLQNFDIIKNYVKRKKNVIIFNFRTNYYDKSAIEEMCKAVNKYLAKTVFPLSFISVQIQVGRVLKTGTKPQYRLFFAENNTAVHDKTIYTRRKDFLRTAMSQIHTTEQIEIGKSKMYDTSEYAFVCVTNFRFVVSVIGK